MVEKGQATVAEVLRAVLSALPADGPCVDIPDAPATLRSSDLLSLCASALSSAHDDDPLVHGAALTWSSSTGDTSLSRRGGPGASTARGSRAAAPMMPAFSEDSQGARILPPPPLSSTGRHNSAGEDWGTAGMDAMATARPHTTAGSVRHGGEQRMTARSQERGGAQRKQVAQDARQGQAAKRHHRRRRAAPLPPASVEARAALKAREDARRRLETFRAARLEKARAEGAGDLLRSLRVLDEASRTTALERAARLEGVEKHFDAQIGDLGAAWRLARRRFDEEWAHRSADLEVEIDGRTSEMRVRHEAESRGLEVAAEGAGAGSAVRFSKRALDLRRTQQLQARAGMADLSVATAAEADALEAEETRAHEEKVAAAAERRRVALEERQARESRQSAARAKELRVKLQRDRKAALETLQQQFANHQRDVEHARTLEAQRKPAPTEGSVPQSARAHSSAAMSRGSAIRSRVEGGGGF